MQQKRKGKKIPLVDVGVAGEGGGVAVLEGRRRSSICNLVPLSQKL